MIQESIGLTKSLDLVGVVQLGLEAGHVGLDVGQDQVVDRVASPHKQTPVNILEPTQQ
jgi:hypothetical protein